MRKMKYLAAAAMIANVVLLPAPVFAATTEPSDAELNAQCTAQLPSRQQSLGFYGIAKNVAKNELSSTTTETEHLIQVLGESSLGGETYDGPFRNGGADRQAFKVEFYTSETTAGSRETWTETTVTTFQYAFGCTTYNHRNNVAGPEFQNYSLTSATWDMISVEDKEIYIAPTTVALETWIRTAAMPVPICQERITGRDKVVSYEPKNDYAGEFGACDVDLIDSAEPMPAVPAV